MRIDGNLRTAGVGARGTARSSGAGTSFFVDEGTATSFAAGPSNVAPAGGIDALLALQAAEDPVRQKKKTLRRGRSLLDTLEAMKTDLLAGQMGEGRLNQLMAVIGQVRERSDPDLDAIIDDIELRARVELAKRGIFPAF